LVIACVLLTSASAYVRAGRAGAPELQSRSGQEVGAERNAYLKGGTRKFPPVYPRPGTIAKVFENERIIVWDETFTVTKDYLHVHVRDYIGIYTADGDMRHMTPDGKVSIAKAGSRYEGPIPHVSAYSRAPSGPHSETSADPSQPKRIFRIEFKGTEPWDCGDY